MTNQILTPPPELVQEWWKSTPVQIRADDPDPVQLIATQAARWGADQELEACVRWLRDEMLAPTEWSTGLRAARRPVQPTLKEQALKVLENVATYEPMGYAKPDNRLSEKDWSIIRRALELVPDAPAATPDPAPTAIPGEQYHEDMGDVTWWRFPVEEPPWVGSPNDSDWPGYHTHFTPLPPVPVEPDPAPTADGGKPLWKAMHAAYEHVLNRDEGELESGHFYAAELRVVADWLDAKCQEKHGRASVAATWIRAEADRTENNT